MSAPLHLFRPLTLAGAAALGVLLLPAHTAAADDPAAPPGSPPPAGAPAGAPAPPAAAEAEAGSSAGGGVSSAIEDRVKQLEEIVRQLQETIRRLQPGQPAPGTPAPGAPPPGAAPSGTPAGGTTVTPGPNTAPGRPQGGAAPAAGRPEQGVVLKSADGNTTLRLRGYLQSDGRAFTSSEGRTGMDSFFLRRVRPVFEGTVYKYWDFKLMPDFASGANLIQDAYLDFHYWPEASLLVGKYKEPVSLERLQSARDLIFVERSVAQNLQPNRDVGVQLHGDLFGGRLGYVAGAFNGVNDGGSSDGDPGNDKDFAGRVFAQPFRKDLRSPLQGLGFGVGGSFGRETDTLSGLSFKTTGRSTFFKYASGVTAGGERSRISPQFFYFHGPAGLMGEYVFSKQQLLMGMKKTDVTNRGGFLQGSYVLTGEKASYSGVVPRKPFDPRHGQWGAVELAARYSRLELDDDIFRRGLADPAASAGDARELTFGLNWYFNRLVKLQLNYAHTDFDRAIKFGGVPLDDEDVFLSRFQIAF